MCVCRQREYLGTCMLIKAVLLRVGGGSRSVKSPARCVCVGVSGGGRRVRAVGVDGVISGCKKGCVLLDMEDIKGQVAWGGGGGGEAAVRGGCMLCMVGLCTHTLTRVCVRADGALVCIAAPGCMPYINYPHKLCWTCFVVLDLLCCTGLCRLTVLHCVCHPTPHPRLHALHHPPACAVLKLLCCTDLC